MTLTDFLASQSPEQENVKDYKVQIVASKKGPASLLINNKQVHSAFDPEKESLRAVSKISSESVLLFGYGLGYAAKAIHETLPKVKTIILFEPNIHLLQTIYSHAKDVFYNQESIFICDSLLVLENLLKQLPDPPELIVNAFYRKEFAEQISAVTECLNQNAHRDSINTNTLNRFSELWTKNILINSEEAFNNPGVNNLTNVASDIPLLLCAGGPTLSELAPHLKEIQKKCLIIAVDTAVRFCQAQNVDPDIIVVVDPQYWNSRHLDHCDTSNSLLIHDVSSHPGVFSFPSRGRFISVPPFPLAELFQAESRIQGTLGSGGSVASTAWSLATCLSSGPIYCSGLDFSFPDLETHFKGSLFEERVHNHSNRFHSCDYHSFHALRDGSPFETEDASGGSVLSDQRLIMYKWWFDKQPKHSNKAALLSGRGLPIQNFEVDTINTILALPDRRNEIDLCIKKATAIEKMFFDFTPAIQKLRTGLTELQKKLKQGIDSLNSTAEIDFPLIDTIDVAIQLSPYRHIPGFTLDYNHRETQLKDNYKTLYSNYVASINKILYLLKEYT